MSSASSQASAWPDAPAAQALGPDADTPAFQQAMADAHASDDEPPPFSLAGWRSARPALTAEESGLAPSPSGHDRDHDSDAVEVPAFFLLTATALLVDPTVVRSETPPASPLDDGAWVGLEAGAVASVTTRPSPNAIGEPGDIALASEVAGDLVAPVSLPTSPPLSQLTRPSTGAIEPGTAASLPAVEPSGAAPLPQRARALLQALKEQSAIESGLFPAAPARAALPAVGLSSPETTATVAAAAPDARTAVSPTGQPLRTTDASTDSVTARFALAAVVAVAPPSAESSTTGSSAGQRDSREQSLLERETVLTLSGPRAAHAVQLLSTVEQSAQASLGAIAAAESLRPSGRLPNQDAVAATLVRSMHLQYRNGVGTAVVNLDPEYLGAVTIALQVERGVVTATLHAANADVRGWMQANESALRRGLADQGLSLDRLIVSEEERRREDASADGRRRPPQEAEPPRRPSRRADTHTFEVVV